MVENDPKSGGHRRLDESADLIELVISQPDGSRCYDAGTHLEVEWSAEGAWSGNVLVQLMHGIDGMLVQNLTDQSVLVSKGYLNPVLDWNLESSDDYYIRIMYVGEPKEEGVVGGGSPAFCIRSCEGFCAEEVSLVDSLAMYAGFGALFCCVLALCCCFIGFGRCVANHHPEPHSSRSMGHRLHSDARGSVPEVVVKIADLEMPPVAFYATAGHSTTGLPSRSEEEKGNEGRTVMALPVGEAAAVAVAVGVPTSRVTPH